MQAHVDVYPVALCLTDAGSGAGDVRTRGTWSDVVRVC